MFHGVKPHDDCLRHVLHNLTPEQMHVAKRLRVNTKDPRSTDPVVAKFCAAMILDAVNHDTAVGEVSVRFGVPRGQLQRLQQSTAQFYGKALAFCQEMNWRDEYNFFRMYKHRLTACVQPALKPLLKLDRMTYERARVLYKANYRSVDALALADRDDIVNVLQTCVRFQMQHDAHHAACTGAFGHTALTEKKLSADAADVIMAHAKRLQEEMRRDQAHAGARGAGVGAGVRGGAGAGSGAAAGAGAGAGAGAAAAAAAAAATGATAPKHALTA